MSSENDIKISVFIQHKGTKPMTIMISWGITNIKYDVGYLNIDKILWSLINKLLIWKMKSLLLLISIRCMIHILKLWIFIVKNYYQIIDSFKMQLININIRESMLSNIDSEIYKYNLNLLEFITKITCNIFVA